MIVMFALAMLLAWSGTAMAGSQLSEAALRNCLTAERQQWFTNTVAVPPTAASILRHQVLVFPYFTSEGDWWSGMVLVNKNAVAGQNIPANTLCAVAIDDKGNAAAQRISETIYAGNMWVKLAEDIGVDETWGKQIMVGVFARNGDNVNLRNYGNSLEGFGMIGNGTEGQGYFAYSADGANALGVCNALGAGSNPCGAGTIGNFVGLRDVWFNYLPEATGSWWRGAAIFNNAPANDAAVRMAVVHEDGTTAATTDRDPLDIRRGEAAVKVFDDLVPGMDETKRARVRACITQRANGDECRPGEGGDLLGFGMFGNGMEAMGYLPLAN